MRKKAKELLTSMKCEIVDSMTEGSFSNMMAELGSELSRDDVQKIECKKKTCGVNWATDIFIDCLRTRDDNTFIKFIECLAKLPQTRDLYNKVKTECKKLGLEYSLDGRQNSNKSRNLKQRAAGISKRQLAVEILVSKKTGIRESLSDGDLKSLLRIVESELIEDDVQAIKSLSDGTGSLKAVDTLVDCVAHGSKKAYMMFIKYMHDNKNTMKIYSELDTELTEYGLSALLPRLPKEHENNRGYSTQSRNDTLNKIIPNDKLARNFEEQLTMAQQCSENEQPHFAAPNKGMGQECSESLKQGKWQPSCDSLSERKDQRSSEDQVQREKQQLSKDLQQIKNQTSSDELEQKKAQSSSEDLQERKDIRNDLKFINFKTEKYKMTSKPRGICLIVGNTDFKLTRVTGGLNLKDREGTEVDIQNLKQIFDWLGFAVKIHENLTAMKLWNSLCYCKDENHESYDCLVVCILTHGQRQYNSDMIFGIDGKHIPLDTIFSLFNGNECPSLKEKPKLFFLQCCRGLREDTSAPKFGRDEHDGPTENEFPENSSPIESDFFIGYATPPGYKSWRNTEKGSWYISKLCEVFEDMARDYDLLTMMTRVNNEVSKFYTENNCKQVPNPSMTLRKQLFFVPVDEEKDTVGMKQ